MIEEAESNLANWNKSHPSSKAIGARELIAFLNNDISKDQLREKIIIATRQYAKRQNTWARGHMKNWNKLYSKDSGVLLKKTLKVVS